MRWRIETFFEDSKQDLGLGDCEMQTDEGASRHWHLLMAAYSLVFLMTSLLLGVNRGIRRLSDFYRCVDCNRSVPEVELFVQADATWTAKDGYK